MVKVEEGKKRWVAFRYERLPNFCYWCSLFDHGEKDCDIGLRQRHSDSVEEFQFGAWLRASSDRPPRKTAVTVSGNLSRSREKSPNESRHNPANHKHPCTATTRSLIPCHPFWKLIWRWSKIRGLPIALLLVSQLLICLMTSSARLTRQ